MDWKKIGKKCLFLPVWLMVPLVILCAVGLVYVFLEGREQTIAAYLLYALSFYTLTVVCVYAAKVLPKKQKAIREKIYSNPLGNRYMTDWAFRTRVSLNLSLAIDLLYVATNLFSWHQNRSWWFVVLAVYYMTLSVMRFLLVHYVHTNEIGGNKLGELKIAIVCAVILLTLNFFLSGAVLMILYQDKGYEYHGIMIYVMALYTFYQTTHAIIDSIKYRKLGSPLMSTAKVVSLASALVSMLNLETAMFASFGADMAKQDQQLMIMLTGAGVGISVITMSVVMTVRSAREIKEIRSVANG